MLATFCFQETFTTFSTRHLFKDEVSSFYAVAKSLGNSPGRAAGMLINAQLFEFKLFQKFLVFISLHIGS